MLFIDDVLLFGWVSGQTPAPEKHTHLVGKMDAYLRSLTEDEAFITALLDVGDGVALSVRQ